MGLYKLAVNWVCRIASMSHNGISTNPEKQHFDYRFNQATITSLVVQAIPYAPVRRVLAETMATHLPLRQVKGVVRDLLHELRHQQIRRRSGDQKAGWVARLFAVLEKASAEPTNAV